MDSSPKQQLNIDREYAVKILELLLKGGILILDEHKYLISHHIRFLKTTQDGSAEAKADSQDKSSLSFSGAGHNKHVDILHIAAAYVNEKGNCDKSPLHLAAETGDTELVDLFLKAGANVNAEDEYKQTPLHLSARNHFNKVVETLLKAGANIDAVDVFKQTPLHFGATCGHKGVVESLLKAGADVNAENVYKQTPLHISTRYGNDIVAALLVNAGASTKIIYATHNCVDIVDYMDNIFFESNNFESTETISESEPTETTSATYTRTMKLIDVESLSQKRLDIESFMHETETYHNDNSQSISDEDSQPIPCGDSQPMACNDRQTIPIDYPIPCESSSTNCDDKPKHSYTLLNPETSPKNPSATTSSHKCFYVPSTPTESHKSSESVHQGLDSIRQQVENHWHKFFFEPTKDWETSLSHDVKAAFQARRIVIPTTINVTQNRNIKNIKKVKYITHYEPGTNLNISHAENVAPGGQIVVHQKRKAPVEDDDDKDESSSDDGSYIYI